MYHLRHPEIIHHLILAVTNPVALAALVTSVGFVGLVGLVTVVVDIGHLMVVAGIGHLVVVAGIGHLVVVGIVGLEFMATVEVLVVTMLVVLAAVADCIGPVVKDKPVMVVQSVVLSLVVHRN